MARRHSYFSLDEANALLPTLGHFFSEMALIIHELEELRDLLKAGGVTLDGDGMSLPRTAGPREHAASEQYFQRCREYDALMEEVLALGVEIVDPEVGTVNFYSWWDGEEVVLSWQFGEPTVQFWFDAGESYAARRPITQLCFDAPADRAMQH